jgi:hypothetical protein
MATRHQANLGRSAPAAFGHRLAEMYWDPTPGLLEAWAAVARAFVMRKPAVGEGVRSEELCNQGGAWVLQFADFTDPEGRTMPFAAILDVLPSVVIVPSLMPQDEPCKELREHVWGYATAAGLRVEMNNQALIDLGAWSRAASPGAWYAGLRRCWMTPRPRLLIVTAGVPDPRGPAHHFYADPITAGDGLLRTVVEAVYSQSAGRPGATKSPWLERLRDDGICALEIVREPTPLRDELDAALRDESSRFLDEAKRLGPLGVVICGERAFSSLADNPGWALNGKSPVVGELPLLHHEPIGSPTTSRGRRQLAEVIGRSVPHG